LQPYSLDKELHELFIEAIMRFEKMPESENWPSHWQRVAEVCSTAAEKAGHANHLDAAFCFLVQEIDFPFTMHMRRSFEISFQIISKGGLG